MTLDQVWFRLCDLKGLRQPVGGRTAGKDPLATLEMADKDGMVPVRLTDGRVVKMKVGGGSVASRLIKAAKERRSEELKKRLAEQAKKPKHRR